MFKFNLEDRVEIIDSKVPGRAPTKVGQKGVYLGIHSLGYARVLLSDGVHLEHFENLKKLSPSKTWEVTLKLKFKGDDAGVDPRRWDWITMLDLTPDQLVDVTALRVEDEDDRSTLESKEE